MIVEKEKNIYIYTELIYLSISIIIRRYDLNTVYC